MPSTRALGLSVCGLCALAACDFSPLDVGDPSGDGGLQVADASTHSDEGASDEDAGVDSPPLKADAGSEPPPLPEEATGSLAELDASDCRIGYDVGTDGVIDARWGYRYRSDGTLAKTIVSNGEGIEATVHDAKGRPLLQCGPASCTSYAYRKLRETWPFFGCGHPTTGTEVVAQTEYLPPRDAPPETWFESYDEAGNLVVTDWMSEFPDPVGESEHERSWRVDEARRLLCYEDDYRTSIEATYHPNGRFATWSLSWDDGIRSEESIACDDQGWMLSRTDGPNWRQDTTYQRDPNGSITHSDTTVTVIFRNDPEDTIEKTEIAIDWYWDEDHRTVQLHGIRVATGETQIHQMSLGPTALSQDSVYDFVGNLTSVRQDLNRDGKYDRTDTYTYEGAGPCREGQNPHVPLPRYIYPRVSCRDATGGLFSDWVPYP